MNTTHSLLTPVSLVPCQYCREYTLSLSDVPQKKCEVNKCSIDYGFLFFQTLFRSSGSLPSCAPSLLLVTTSGSYRRGQSSQSSCLERMEWMQPFHPSSHSGPMSSSWTRWCPYLSMSGDFDIFESRDSNARQRPQQELTVSKPREHFLLFLFVTCAHSIPKLLILLFLFVN